MVRDPSTPTLAPLGTPLARMHRIRPAAAQIASAAHGYRTVGWVPLQLRPAGVIAGPAATARPAAWPAAGGGVAGPGPGRHRPRRARPAWPACWSAARAPGASSR